MKKYYFTFGFGHAHPNCYTIIEANDCEEARLEMCRIWGDRWAFQYESAEQAGVTKWNLKEIK